MAHKGQFKPPVQPLSVALERAMEFIDAYGSCALFMVAGKICASKRQSEHCEKRMQKLASNLVGVYDDGADARWLREDIEVFYR